MTRKIKTIGIFEITILMIATFALAHMVSETNTLEIPKGMENPLIEKARDLVLGWLSSGIVSAQSEGLHTCKLALDGSICQEYVPSECAESCSEGCFPGRAENFALCKVGTCIDLDEGTCSPNTPQFACERNEEINSRWVEQEINEINECRAGCCLIGNGAQFVTERSCNLLGERRALPVEFQQVNNELECLALVGLEDEGACVLEDSVTSERDCRFVTKESCNQMGGEFNKDMLCSAEELNTECTPQERTGIIEGKDEVYWFDSCGNRENIYDSNKQRSYNDGKVLSKEQSCSLAVGNDILANQESCGNCDYLLGSVAGTPREQDEKALYGDYVCRDLSCIDKDGEKRLHGESWCEFDGQIGTQGDGNERRSIDVPGSSHYKEVCLNGEITTETCSAGRREICTENVEAETGFTHADCRINQWQRCVDANTDEKKLERCEEMTDCVLKQVDIDKFEFSLCVPKYPPGFSLNEEFGGETAESLCNIATQKCTYIKKKGIFGSKKVNQKCTEEIFTETMNNLCISLGDCGAQVNVAGEYADDGYNVDGAPELGDNYKSELRRFSQEKEGQSADSLKPEEILVGLGIDPTDPNADVKFAETLGYIGLGSAGVVVAAYALELGTSAVFASLSSGAGISEGAVSIGSWGASMNAFVNVAGGVAAGAAIGYFIGKAFGLTGDELLAATIVGAVGGGIVAYIGYSQGYFALFSLSFLFWTVVIVVVFILILKLFGFGKTSKNIIEFQCLPWQPPKGGANCATCGSDGLPCNKYKCESLGQTCVFLNEGTSDEICEAAQTDDVTPPVITPNEEALNVFSPGFTYTEVSNLGFKINGPTIDGCLPVYTPVTFGVDTDEAAQCKMSVERTDFDDMEDFFGGSNLYKKKHVTGVTLPNLEALRDVGVNVNERANFNLYIRCSDKLGNVNTIDYTIQFCLSPQDDITPPIVSRFTPESGNYVAYESQTQEVDFFVNEPSECKWDSQDVDYDVMINDIECDEDPDASTIFGYACNMTLPTPDEENNYYIRCKDQPYLQIENPDNKPRNKNSQSTVYNLKKSLTPLTIVSTMPNGTITSGGLVTLDLEVRTSGGADGTQRYCEFNHGAGFAPFFETGSDVHRQMGLGPYGRGSYSMPVQCRDEAGNTAEGSIDFSIFVDNVGPMITRFYNKDGALNVVTNEESVCAYDFNSCGFEFSEGRLMSGEGLLHTTSFDTSITHFIKCQDSFTNPSACIVIEGGYF